MCGGLQKVSRASVRCHAVSHNSPHMLSPPPTNPTASKVVGLMKFRLPGSNVGGPGHCEPASRTHNAGRTQQLHASLKTTTTVTVIGVSDAGAPGRGVRV